MRVVGQSLTPQPEGFVEFAAVNGTLQICARFGLTEYALRAMLRAMPAEWQAERTRLMRANQSESGKKNIVKALAFHADLAKAGLPPLKRIRRPDSFPAAALMMSRADLVVKFGVSRNVVAAWADSLTAEQKAAVRDAAISRRDAALRKNRIMQAARAVALKAERKANALPKAGKPRRNRAGNFNKPTEAAPLSGGMASMAAQALRRYFAPVYSATVLSKALTGYYVVGTRRMREAEMIDLARAKGWSPDSWRQVAA
jgi:hypothetical protein